MRSLLLSPEPPLPARAGLPLRVLHLARALGRELDLDVVALGPPPAPVAAEPFALMHLPGDWSRARTAVRAAWEPTPLAQVRSRAIASHLRSPRWDVIQAHELSMLRYAHGPAPCVLDAADVLSEVKASLAATDSRRPMRPWWQFETLKARRCERAAARAVTAVTVPKHADAETFERLGARHVVVVPNGVDLDTIAHELPARGSHIAFVGYFAWRPNVEAGLELCREILPRVRAHAPDASLSLIGGVAPAELGRYADESVELTGAVPDVLPHLHRARVTVMPLRAGGGSRLKVLEALAAGVPVVATPFAVSGIEVRHGTHALVAERPRDLAALALSVIADDELARRLSIEGRRLVEERYGWPAVAQPLVALHYELGERARIGA
jgi:glycosyltransferase involved in cell wall biosynthesis